MTPARERSAACSRPSTLARAVLLALLAPATTLAAPSGEGARSEFDVAFFGHGVRQGSRTPVDLERFAWSDVVVPGTYDSNVRRNGEWVGRIALVFAEVPGMRGGQLCLDADLLRHLGLDVARIERERAAAMPGSDLSLAARLDTRPCGDIGDVIPGAVLQVDNAGLDVDIVVPQIMLARSARGEVDPVLWDAGITAGLLGYSTNVYHRQRDGERATHLYSGLQTGLNLGAWRLRHEGSLAWRSGASPRYQRQRTLVQRDITPWRATLSVGEVYTRGDLANAIALRGVTVVRENRMLADALGSYAPVVRGIAQTHARVTVHQNGRLLHDMSVAPGPFEIDDLSVVGNGGDLLLTIHEADGRQQRIVVPHATAPQLVRAGYTGFDVAAGQARAPGAGGYREGVLDAGMAHGVSDRFTGLAGVSALRGYVAVRAGMAVATRWGAMSLEATRSQMEAGGAHATPSLRAARLGHSVRLGYARTLSGSGTNIAVAAYRHSSSGYLGLADALAWQATRRDGPDAWLPPLQRSRMELTLSQQLGERRGALYATVAATHYQGAARSANSATFGYGNHWRGVALAVNAQRGVDVDVGGASRHVSALNVSVGIPLGPSLRAPRFTAQLGHAGNSGPLRRQLGLAGLADSEGRLRYATSLASGQRGLSTQANASLGYAADRADVMAGIGVGGGDLALSAGASGLLVLHGGGVTAGRGAVSDAVGLVHAPEGAGARVTGGARVDARGYAVTTSLSPYRLNRITLDPRNSHPDLLLEQSTVVSVPRLGAVVRLGFVTRTERMRLFMARREGGGALPFGADVLDAEGQVRGVVGQAGRVIVRGLDDGAHVLRVRWGGDEGASCVMAVPAVDGSWGGTALESVTCDPDDIDRGVQGATAGITVTGFPDTGVTDTDASTSAGSTSGGSTAGRIE